MKMIKGAFDDELAMVSLQGGSPNRLGTAGLVPNVMQPSNMTGGQRARIEETPLLPPRR